MLATRFGHNRSEVSRNRALTEIEMRETAPSIFALEPHESRSARYTYVPTIDVVRGLAKHGFQPFHAGQSISRIPGKSAFTKHMVRLRHADTIAQGGSAEIVMVNSHDGTSSYQMMCGWFEFLCMNGLVRGDKADDIRVPHKGDIVNDVVQGAHTLLGKLGHMNEVRAEWRGTLLSPDERMVFASAALQLRYDEGKAIVEPHQTLRTRRLDERGQDLWTTFNVVQENLIRGGQNGRTADNRRATTREIKGIDQNIKLNRALWTLAEGMAKLKNAA